MSSYRRFCPFSCRAIIFAIPEAQAVETSSNAAETEAVTVTAEAIGSLISVPPEEALDTTPRAHYWGNFTFFFL